jgi:hypothetical protein
MSRLELCRLYVMIKLDILTCLNTKAKNGLLELFLQTKSDLI